MKNKRYWYRVEMLSGHDTYCFFGSCSLNEKQLTQAFSIGTWVMVEDLVYFDANDRAQGWSEWDPNYLARIHLNPAYVVSIMPLQGDPRKESSGLNEILTLPRIPSDGTETDTGVTSPSSLKKSVSQQRTQKKKTTTTKKTTTKKTAAKKATAKKKASSQKKKATPSKDKK